MDNGRPQRSETCRVIIDVFERPVESPHRPTFAEQGVRVSVAENDPVGTFVQIMSATDQNKGEKLWYSLQGGEEQIY